MEENTRVYWPSPKSANYASLSEMMCYSRAFYIDKDSFSLLPKEYSVGCRLLAHRSWIGLNFYNIARISIRSDIILYYICIIGKFLNKYFMLKIGLMNAI